MAGKVVSITFAHGLPKRSAESAEVTVDGIVGDSQRDLRYHGGPDRALCLFSLERMQALQAQGHPIAPGSTGENLLLSGLDWDTMLPERVLRVGDVELEITTYAAPCKTIRPSFADADSNHISQKLHPGWSRLYTRVLQGGTIRVGDAVEIRTRSPRPD